MTSKEEGKWGSVYLGKCGHTGPVVREYLKVTVRNVTQRAWWVRMRLCTNSGAVYSRSSYDDVVCLYYWVTLVLSVCALFIAGVELLVP